MFSPQLLSAQLREEDVEKVEISLEFALKQVQGVEYTSREGRGDCSCQLGEGNSNMPITVLASKHLIKTDFLLW
jgi:hypothetical protein